MLSYWHLTLSSHTVISYWHLILTSYTDILVSHTSISCCHTTFSYFWSTFISKLAVAMTLKLIKIEKLTTSTKTLWPIATKHLQHFLQLTILINIGSWKRTKQHISFVQLAMLSAHRLLCVGKNNLVWKWSRLVKCNQCSDELANQ